MDSAKLVDVHAHWTPRGLPDMAERLGDSRWPQLVADGTGGRIVQRGRTYRLVDESYWSLERRLATLDELGVSKQVLSPLPVMLPQWADAKPAGDFCTAYNELLAAAVQEYAGRFLAFGIVPLQDPQRSIEAIARARDDGLAGLEFGTSIGDGLDLGQAPYADVFASAAEAGLPILLHPNAGETFARPHGNAVELGVGVGCETARAMAAMHLAGTLRQSPDLRLCLSHGGGAYLWLWPRFKGMAEREGAPPELPPGLHVDSAGLAEANFGYLQDQVGAHRMLFGSDMPATTTDRAAALVDTCTRVAGPANWNLPAVTAAFLDGGSDAAGAD